MNTSGDLSPHAGALLDQVKAELTATGRFHISLVLSTEDGPLLIWLPVPEDRRDLVCACIAVRRSHKVIHWAALASDSYMLTAEAAGTEDLTAVEHGTLGTRFDAGDPSVTEALSLWVTYLDGTTESRMIPYVRRRRQITFGDDTVTKGRWSSIEASGYVPDCLALAVGIAEPTKQDLARTGLWIARCVATGWPNGR